MSLLTCLQLREKLSPDGYNHDQNCAVGCASSGIYCTVIAVVSSRLFSAIVCSIRPFSPVCCDIQLSPGILNVTPSYLTLINNATQLLHSSSFFASNSHKNCTSEPIMLLNCKQILKKSSNDCNELFFYFIYILLSMFKVQTSLTMCYLLSNPISLFSISAVKFKKDVIAFYDMFKGFRLF